MSVNLKTHDKNSSVQTPLLDFWTLGGLSILLWGIMHIASVFRNDVPAFQFRFLQVGALFSILSLVCNHPHFLISYRFGYGRGLRFIVQNWFSLIGVPVILLICYLVAYFDFNGTISEQNIILVSINRGFQSLGLAFRLGDTTKLGEEIVGVSIWVMYLTVGWHYSKQVFGCMMVYAFYGGYPLQTWQRQIFKWSAISVAIYQFIFMAKAMEAYAINGNIQDPRFQGFHLSSIGLPPSVFLAATLLVIALAISSLFVMVQIYRSTKRLPSLNFLVPWVAFYVWWIPFGQLPEFYFLMVPFFHSLQYLPFAMKIENAKIPKNKWLNTQISLRVLGLIAVGFLAFELVPSFLDKSLDTESHQTAWFFTTAFAVFINIHHFFIDSVAWKFKNPEVKAKLLFR